MYLLIPLSILLIGTLLKASVAAQQIRLPEQTLFAEQKTRVSNHSRAEAAACFVPQNTVIVPPVLVLQQGHSGLITTVAFAPGTNIMATASMDGTARLWDNKSGQLLAVCLHGEPISNLAFARNGETFVTFSAFGLLRFWNTQTGRLIAGVTLIPNNKLANTAFACDGSVVTTFVYQGKTQIWDMATGVMKSAFDWNADSLQRYGRPLKFIPDGKTLVFLREEQEEADPNAAANKRYKIVTLELVDALTGLSKAVLPPFEQRADQGANSVVAFSADAALLALGSEDGNVHLWNLRSGKMLPVLHNSRLPITFLSFSPDGKRLASASNQATRELPGDVSLWDAATGKRLALLPGKPEIQVLALCFSQNGQILATATLDGRSPKSSLQFWDVLTGKVRAQTDGAAHVDHLTFSPDDSLIVGSEPEGALRTWNARTLQLAIFASGRRLAFPTYSPDGSRIAAVAANGFLQVWEAMTGRLLDNFAISTESRISDRFMETEPVFTPDGQSVAYVIPHKGAVEIYDLKTRSRRKIYTPNTKTSVIPDILVFAPDGKTLAISANDKTRIVDLATGNVLTTLENGFSAYTNYNGTGERPTAARFSRDGKSFIGLRESAILLFDTASGHLRSTIATGRYQGNLQITDDGTLLAAMLDREVRLYDVATGALKSTLKGTDGEYLYNILLSPDGRQALTRGTQFIRVWDTVTGHIVSTLETTQINGAPTLYFSSAQGDFAFADDGRHVGMRLPSNRLLVWETATGKPVTSLPHNLLAAFPPGMRRPLWVIGDTLIIHDPLSGDPLVMLTAFPGLTFAEQQRLQENPDDVTLNARSYAWLAQTPDGYYEGSADITTFLRWNVSGMLFPGTRYAEAHHQPTLVQKALNLNLPVENKNK